MVPVVVPFTTTETPGRDAPEESVTLPETDFCCWEEETSSASFELDNRICLPTTLNSILLPSNIFRRISSIGLFLKSTSTFFSTLIFESLYRNRNSDWSSMLPSTCLIDTFCIFILSFVFCEYERAET